jgi:hypothetical protein
MTCIIYDTGALIAAESNDRLLWSLHRAAVRKGLRPIVPAGVLGQAWRGGPQPNLSRLLRGTDTAPLTEEAARAIGTRCAQSATADLIDASVVTAARPRDVVVTSDPDDIAHLASSARAQITIHTV